MTHHITVNEIRSAGEFVISQLPAYWRDLLTPHLPRVCQELSWIFVKGGTVVDIGGGTGFHTSILARLGMKAICVDNFKTRGKGTAAEKMSKMKECGIHVVQSPADIGSAIQEELG